MSLETMDKGMIIISCILIAICSVFGVIIGYIFWAVQGEDGWMVLLVGSVLAFVGSIFGIFYASTRDKSKEEKEVKKIRRSTKETFLWLGLTLISGAGAVLTFFFGMFRARPVGLMIALIAILASACLFSLFMLVSGKSLRREKPLETIPPIDVKENHIDE